MKQTQLADLQKVAEAAFQREYNALRPLFEAEARVRQQLKKLDAQKSNIRQNCALTEGYCITGTDVLWNGWEESSRRRLNLELARLRAQRLSAMQALRSAFGRKEAIAHLSKTQQEALKRAQFKKMQLF